MSPAAGDVAQVLLPDGQWYRVRTGSYRVWAAHSGGRFEFRALEDGRTYRGPQSSVLATIESTSSDTA